MTGVALSVPVAVTGLGSALFFAVSTVSKHVSAGQGPDAPRLRAASIWHFVLATARHPLYLVGTVADIVGLGLQVLALHLGALAVVQPLLLSGLVLAVLLRGPVNRRLPVRQAWWAAAVAATLGGFLVLVSGGATPAHTSADRLPAAISAVCGVGLVAVTGSVATRSRSSRVRAGLWGAAAGTLYAAGAALIKDLSNLAPRGFVGVITSWQLYALIIVGAAGLVVGQIAFQAGPLSAGLSVASTLDPLVSIVIGVAIFDERLRLGPGHGVFPMTLLIAMSVGVLQLCRSGESPDETPSRASRRGDRALT